MSENKDNKEFAFIKEIIKEKPVNKKQRIKQAIFVAIFAAIFGFVACLVFVLFKPILSENIGSQQEPVVEVSTDEPEPEAEETPETEPEADPVEPEVVEQELEIADYQELQNKLYDVGKAADYFLVTVTGVSAQTDWFNTPYEKEGQGSGIIISNTEQELLVLTQKSVVENAQKIQITFANETTTEGTLKSFDGNTGMAVISIPTENLAAVTYESVQVAELGNSVGINRGDLVVAVGSPLGTNYSIMTGNITSVNNEVSTIDRNLSVFTTNIVGSASGSGALLNTKGQVIGLIMQDYAAAGSENTLTAVSASELKGLINELIAGNAVQYLGMKLSTVTEELAAEYTIPEGVYIISIVMDSPAMSAGLQNGDVIVKMNEKEIVTVLDYETELNTISEGRDASITVKRMGGDGLYHDIECVATVGVME